MDLSALFQPRQLPMSKSKSIEVMNNHNRLLRSMQCCVIEHRKFSILPKEEKGKDSLPWECGRVNAIVCAMQYNGAIFNGYQNALGSNGPLVVANGTLVVSNGPLVVCSGTLVVSNCPLVVFSCTLVVSNGPLVVHWFCTIVQWSISGVPLSNSGCPLVIWGIPLSASSPTVLFNGGPSGHFYSGECYFFLCHYIVPKESGEEWEMRRRRRRVTPLSLLRFW